MTTLEVFTPSWTPASYLQQDDAAEAARLTADLEWLAAHGVRVSTATLTDDARRFVEHDAVRFLMNVLGDRALPVILADGTLRSVGRYPDRRELAGYVGLEAAVEADGAAAGVAVAATDAGEADGDGAALASGAGAGLDVGVGVGVGPGLPTGDGLPLDAGAAIVDYDPRRTSPDLAAVPGPVPARRRRRPRDASGSRPSIDLRAG